MEQQQTTPMTLPNSTTILVLGICSIATCWCTGFIGLGLGITSLVMSKKARLTYEAYPQGTFTESSYNNMKAGKICGIIGVCLSALAVIYFIIYFLIIGFAVSQAGMHDSYYY
ncbi:MAG: DUF4190 domain-containing protein [Flavobacteriales bacterium]|nr:DUF4190 domain-containing protein [Flavobacteriales bacterium]